MRFTSRLKHRVSVEFMAFIILLPLMAKAQVPFVSTSSKMVGKAQESIALTGINFGISLGDIRVSFGGVLAAPTAISDQYMEVKVPIGASYDFIKVINTNTGLSGATRQSFLPSFGGQNPFDETRMTGHTDFQSESGLYEIAVADFDGDGNQDIATANNNSNLMSVFRNTSTVGTFDFVKTTLNVSPGAKSIHVAAGDLNGDSKPDLIAAESNGARLFIFKNTSSIGSISFVMQTLTLTGSFANQIKIADLDLDGKPDLIVTDQQSVSRLFIVKNQSTVANITFATPQSLTLSTKLAGTDGIGIGDLNGDNYPDIIVGEFLTATTNIFVIRNASSPGTINVIQQDPIVLSTTVSSFGIGDLDNDGKDEVVVTLVLSSSIMVFKNNTTGNDIVLANGVPFEAGLKPWGVDLGDMDGDGKIDIVVANLSTYPATSAQKTITILNNQSTGTTFSFAKKQLATNSVNRMVKLSDLDADGRPDIAFASVDDNSCPSGCPASKVLIYRNVNCVVPVVTPSGPLTICSGYNQLLESSINAGATYEWFKGGISQGPPSAASTFNVTLTGFYTVQMVEGTCSKTSNAVQINVVAQAPLGPASITPVSPVCLNGTLNLSVSNVGATSYEWTGPGGYTASGLNVSRPSFQASMAGEYNLNVITGTCITQSLSVIVDAVSIPNISVQFSGSDIICTGDSKVLSIFPTVTGYTYQWAEQTAGNISGETNATLLVNSTGKYLAKLTSVASPSCAAIQTPVQKIRLVSLPIVAFTNPAQICTGQEVPFEDQSTLDIDAEDPEVNYLWNFDDGVTETQPQTTHIFDAGNTYDVSLTVSYRDNSCPAVLQKSIPVSQAPLVQITTPSGLYSICSGESIKLQVPGSFTSYLWSTGETTPFIYVDQSGNYTVDVTAGCTVTAARTITSSISPNVTVSASPETVNLGDPTVLSASGLVEYHWKPNSTVEDSLSAITNATPVTITTYTVYGKGSNGCYGEASIMVNVVGASIISTLAPPNFFSPNGDNDPPENEVWNVPGMDLFAQCGVTIFDERGFKVYEAKPYLNDWDGYSQKGQKLPGGVYFYIIRCDDSSEILTGSINLIR